MYKSYLAYNQLKEYLETLQENGLIDYDVGKRFYKTTEKGTRLSQLQNKLEEIAPIVYIKTENSWGRQDPGRIHGDKKEAKPAPAETRTLVSNAILFHSKLR